MGEVGLKDIYMQKTSIGDFSKFPVGQKKSAGPEEKRSFWSGMNKKNKIYFSIIIFSLILTAIFILSLLMKNEKNVRPAGSYTPPVGYPLNQGASYTPPFP